MQLSNFQKQALQDLKNEFGDKWFTCSECIKFSERPQTTLSFLYESNALIRKINPEVEFGWDSWLYRIKPDREKELLTFDDGSTIILFKDEILKYMEDHPDAMFRKMEPYYD